MIKNMIKHFGRVTKHKWVVFKLCVKAGIPYRGLVHDLSKYSPAEFFESAKYYQDERSPISISREINGYSKAALHHKGRNKHHGEYWYDYKAKESMPIIPYPYVTEMICDNLAAGIIYNGKKWSECEPLKYWDRTEQRERINENVKRVLREVFTQVDKQGIDKTINKKNLMELYEKYCGVI